MARALFLGLILGFLAAPALADPGPEPNEERSEVAETAQDDADDQPAVDFHFRLRGRFVDELADLGDVTIQRLSAWSDTRIGDRVQIRATYDVGETRIHDLWLQYDLGGGIRLRAGRSAPLWLAEFTDAPFGFQMIGAAYGAALTWTRETGVFLFVDRGGYSGRVHVVNGSGWKADDNGFKDVLASVGRSFAVGGGTWKLDVGHYEGRDGPDDDLTPKRQTAVHLDGTLGGQTFRTSVYQREQNGREHLGGFARYRKRLPNGLWGALEIGGESNHGPPEASTHSSYFKIGSRYELPWVLTYLAADYRRRFGQFSDNEIFVALQWILDFKNPRRN